MFVQIDPKALFTRLDECGFTQRTSTGHEVVFERYHKNSNFKIMVYTSAAYGSSRVRGCGNDAIRVIAIQSGVRGKLYSKRIYRVTSQETVVERTIERAREAYGVINAYIKGKL